MERNQNDANQSQNPSTTTHLSSEQLQQQQPHTHHHEMNEVELEVQQHLNEEVEAANYETVYVIEVKSLNFYTYKFYFNHILIYDYLFICTNFLN